MVACVCMRFGGCAQSLCPCSFGCVLSMYRGIAFFPLKIGDYVSIGSRCVIQASVIGSKVDIGDDVILVRTHVFGNVIWF